MNYLRFAGLWSPKMMRLHLSRRWTEGLDGRLNGGASSWLISHHMSHYHVVPTAGTTAASLETFTSANLVCSWTHSRTLARLVQDQLLLTFLLRVHIQHFSVTLNEFCFKWMFEVYSCSVSPLNDTIRPVKSICYQPFWLWSSALTDLSSKRAENDVIMSS